MRLFFIALIAFFATIKTWSYYFWHDDFSVLYGGRVNECIFTWPYGSYCSIFPFLDSLFGNNANLYFILGSLLFIFSTVMFYLFAKNFLSPKNSFLVASMFATGFIGSGVFLEMYSSITSFASLSTLLASLNLLMHYLKHSKTRHFILFILCFSLSIIILQARSITYIFPPIILYFLFGEKTTRKKLAELIVIAIVFVLMYQMPLNSGEGIVSLFVDFDVFNKVQDFITTIGQIIIPFSTLSERAYLFSGTTFFLVLGIYAVKFRRDKKISKLFVFSLIWIVVMYVPYALRTDGPFEASHRYLVFISVGVILLLSIFSRYKIWKLVVMMYILVAWTTTQDSFSSHAIQSAKRQSFYHSLQSAMPDIEKGSLLYFDFAPNHKFATDFFRVGYTPSESAISTIYDMNYNDLILITDRDEFLQYVSDYSLENLPFHSFYYGDEGLVDTTSNSQHLIKYSDSLDVDLNISTEIHYDDKLQKWIGKTPDLFYKTDHLATLPMNYTLKISAQAKDVEYPYSHHCVNCVQYDTSVRDGLEYLSEARNIKNQSHVVVSSEGENKIGNYLIDKDQESYWLANRQKWFSEELPVIEFSFDNPVSLNGFWFKQDGTGRDPSMLEIKANGEVLNYSLIRSNGIVQVNFDNVQTTKLSIRILETISEDAPLIYEMYFIPPGFSFIDFSRIAELANNPAGYISSSTGYTYFEEYVKSGANACIKWKADGYGEGELPIILEVDGEEHEYSVNVPPTGMKSTEIGIGCLHYPIELSWRSLNISFPGSDKH